MRASTRSALSRVPTVRSPEAATHRARSTIGQMKHLAAALAILVASVILACTDRATAPAPTATAPREVPATPTAAGTAAATSTVAATPGPPRPPVPVGPFAEVPTTVWLIDFAAGVQRTLLSDIAPGSVTAAFSGSDSAVVRLGRIAEERVFTLGGIERARRPIPTASARCKPIGTLAAEIDGRRYEVNCGSFSPDGHRMLYNVDTGTFTVPTGRVAPKWDQWLLDLRTGQRMLLQRDLRHCGSCDGRYGPQWSPTSRYVVSAELYTGADGGFVFLSDTTAGTTRRIAAGPSYPQGGYEPDWGSTTDVLLRPGESGGSVIEDLATGRILALPTLAWPALLRRDRPRRLLTGGRLPKWGRCHHHHRLHRRRCTRC